jgi:hypothetical protein
LTGKDHPDLNVMEVFVDRLMNKNTNPETVLLCEKNIGQTYWRCAGNFSGAKRPAITPP